MRLSVQNQPQIDALSKPTGDALRALASRANGWSKAQHKGDGSHGDVTATSLEVSGTTTLGKINLRSVTYTEPPGTGGTINDVTVAGLAEVSCLRIVPESSPLLINGIDATGRTRGDLLWVINCDFTLDPCDVYLMMEQAGSLAANRFAETTASPTSVGGQVIINGARGVLLRYDYQESETNVTPNGARWRVLDPSV
jgi:hypothetical protein